MNLSLKYFFVVFVMHCFFYNASAQTTNISGVINNYAAVTSFGSQSVNLLSAVGFAVGDKVLLIQMKGASIDTTNTSNFGTINSYNDAGNYEMLVISAISSTTITFTAPILRTYSVLDLVQLVKVPVYNNVNVTGPLTCAPWNGLTCGVLIFEATGNVALNANIDVTGKGFLGGAIATGQFFSCAGNTTGFKLPITSLLSANKGEGITIIKSSFAKGLGALANGGGAGNDVNGGGAGGGNYGLGGHGGNTKCSSSPIALCGGYEGKNCIYSNTNNKIFLGGGGGAGHENDGVSTAGVAGGGIVIIRSGGSIIGNGNFINANGNNNTLIAGNDGQGGGGAGGTVLIEACSTSSLNISVIGGNGGTDNFSGPDCHGKGGGGGGGVIWTSSSLSYISFLNGGNPGVFTNAASQCFNTSNGATTGQSGGTLAGLMIPGATPLSSSSSFSLTTSSNCISNNNSTATASVSSNATSPVFSYTWTNSGGVIVSQTNNTSSLSNSVPNLSNGFYTLSVQMNAPCGPINTQTLNINCVITPTLPCLGTMTGTGMSICNQYSFNITPSQTITPLNYGSQGYACNNTTQPDISFNILGGGWRVNKFGWFFSATTAGQVSGYNSLGVLQTFTFSPSNTITPLSYSGTFVQMAINGVATGQLLNQTTFSISLHTDVFTGNSYTYCPSAAVSIAINPIAPATGGPWSYNWLPGNLSGSPVNVSPSTSTIYSVTAISPGGCSSSTTVSVNINCVPTPTPLCSGTLGSPVFFEDFGSGSTLYGPALPPGVTNYLYLQGIPNNGTYVISSSSNPSGTNAGYVNDNQDHTGNTNGYMMVVNSDYPASEVYRKHVTGLCQNTTYVFSAYLANNNSPDAVTNVCGASYVYANIKFQTEFPVGTVLNSTTSGNLAVASTSLTLPWIQYGFAFTTGTGQTSADVVLINNAPGGCGNDYVVDDISLAPCGPGVSLSIVPNNTLFCLGDSINLQSNITSGGYTNPSYQWQYSNNGGITWTNIIGATSPNYNITTLAASQVGSYQLIVAENGNINLPSCSIIAGPLTFTLAANCLNAFALFSSPDTVCVNQSFSVSNLSTGANSNYWTFCQSNTNSTPQAINLGNVGFFNGPVFITIAKEGTDYYAFVVNNTFGDLTKLFFGSSLLNTPIATNLGNISGAFPGSLEDIHIEYEGGNWYGIVVGGFGGSESIIRIDFGSSLANNAPTAVNYGNIGGLDYPQRLKIFKNGANYYGFTTNRNNNTFTRFSFGTSISNTPTGLNLGNIGALNTPDAIAIVNVASMWYGYIINEGDNTITRLDFGNSLLNTPTGTNLGNTGALNGPRGIDMWTECNEVRGLITNRFSDDLLNMNLSAGPTGPVVTTSFGNIANFSFPHSITRFRSGDTLFAFITNVSNNTLSRIYYPGCVNSSIASSTLTAPPAISYNAPGNYYINLVINEGQITQTNYCKQVTVIASPTIIVSNANICAGSSASLTASGANSYSWTSSPSLSSTTDSLVTTTPSVSESYTVTGFIGSCTNTAVSSVTIIPSPSITITPTLSTICSGQTTTLTAIGASTYTWNSSGTLNTTSGNMVIASPLSTTNYSVTGTSNTCTNSAVVTVSVLANPTLILSPNATICQGAGSSTTLTATGATSYTWSNAATLSSSTGSAVIASPNVITNYTVTGANAACTNTAIVTVSVNPSPTITATTVNNTSCGLSNGSATVISLPSNNTYTWSSGVSSTTNTASNLVAGNYTITINNGACQTNTVISIIGSVSLSIISSTVLPSNCNLNDGSISITDNMIGSNYSWSPNVSVTNNAAGLPTGNYALTIINGACTTSTIFNVGSIGGPLGFISITGPSCDSDDGSIVIDSIKEGVKPYSINFNNNGLTNNMIFENLSTGNYTLSIRDSSLCETEYVLTVPSNKTDFTLYIPNTFTPNNDKVNDIWLIKGTCLDKMNCLIYNRWGEKIRELRDINEGWDGTYKGVSVPDGVYIYLIEVSTKEGTINKAGHITVFR